MEIKVPFTEHSADTLITYINSNRIRMEDAEIAELLNAILENIRLKIQGKKLQRNTFKITFNIPQQIALRRFILMLFQDNVQSYQLSVAEYSDLYHIFLKIDTKIISQ